MKTRRELSAAEWELMRVVWDAGEALTVRDVLERAYPNEEKAYTTVQTIMNILVDKGFLRREKRGPLNFYTSVVARDTVLRSSMRGVAQRMFGGSVGAMATYLVSTAKLSDEDIVTLRELLDRAGEKES
jgi:predicted transcriptional regulator